MDELGHMRVLIVAHDATGLEQIAGILARAGYFNVLSTEGAIGAQDLCAGEKPDLVILDLSARDHADEELVDGLRRLGGEPDGVPVLVVGDEDAGGARRRALVLGARDVVTKPFEETELLARVRNLLEIRQLRALLADRNALLIDAVRERTRGLDNARTESLAVLASIGEFYDDDTSQHTERVGETAALIARALDLPESFAVIIRDAAPLHDIGKVGISRRILLKPGQLTPAERMHMMRHVEIGASILGPARSPVLRLAAEIARTHHERWDGNGYLAGLAGEDIPLAGRITAVADVFDVLTHKRPYKPTWPIDRALAEIADQAGRQFDPRVVQAFATIDPQALAVLAAGENAQAA
jgi:putative two-component system response regulator